MEDDDWQPICVESLHDVLAEAGEGAGELWLWCIYCERFFQAKHLRTDYLGNRQGCAFCECAGFDVALHEWSTFADGDPAWPTSVEELHHGLKLRPPPD